MKAVKTLVPLGQLQGCCCILLDMESATAEEAMRAIGDLKSPGVVSVWVESIPSSSQLSRLHELMLEKWSTELALQVVVPIDCNKRLPNIPVEWVCDATQAMVNNISAKDAMSYIYSMTTRFQPSELFVVCKEEGDMNHNLLDAVHSSLESVSRVAWVVVEEEKVLPFASMVTSACQTTWGVRTLSGMPVLDEFEAEND